MFRTHRRVRCTVLVATAALTLGLSTGAAHALSVSPRTSTPPGVVIGDPPIRHPLNPCVLFPRLCDHPRPRDTTTTVPSHPTGDPDPVPDPTPPTVIVHADPNFTG